MTQTHRILSLAQAVIDKAGAEGVMIATAESCTGGMIAAALTDVPGSSAVFDRAFVTYSNEAKTEMLGVPEALINRHGAVSAEVARASRSRPSPAPAGARAVKKKAAGRGDQATPARKP